jgi:hypothetical protein
MACVCENVLREEDGVISAIRIVDRFTVDAPSDLPPTTRAALDVRALVGVKSEGLSGTHHLKVVVIYPSGLRKELQEFPVELNPDKDYQGFNLTARLAVEVKEYGVYWLDVLWDGEMLTRIPFKVIRRERPVPEQAQSSS